MQHCSGSPYGAHSLHCGTPCIEQTSPPWGESQITFLSFSFHLVASLWHSFMILKDDQFTNTSHVTRIGISYSKLHNPEVANTRFQYESCDLYWPDDVNMTQYRSILSGFQPMRTSVTLQKRINDNISYMLFWYNTCCCSHYFKSLSLISCIPYQSVWSYKI